MILGEAIFAGIFATIFIASMIFIIISLLYCIILITNKVKKELG